MFQIHDKKYDLTSFKSIHPGGEDIFEHLKNNTDVTPIIYSYHSNIPKILKTLEKYETPQSTDTKILFESNFKYDKYLELKSLVYTELYANKIPLHWSTSDTWFNILISYVIYGLWIYCIYNSATITVLPILLLSFMTVGNGFLIYHETCHYSPFKKPYFNTIFPKQYMLPFVSEDDWKYSHNYLHHSFTNTQHDCDIEALIPILCYSDRHVVFNYHSFQHIYIFILLSFTSISKGPLISILNKKYYRLIYNIALLYIFKFKYFCIMHGIIGFMFAFIAQLSHIQYECIQINQEDKNDYLYNQVSSSMNYKTDDILSRYICFGLDIQIEHHLFPNLPHSTLRKIQHIVRKYCLEHDIPYIEKKSMFSAMYSFISYLHHMGTTPEYNFLHRLKNKLS